VPQDNKKDSKAGEQSVMQRRTCSGQTTQGNFRAGFDVQVDVAQHFVVGSLRISEADVVEAKTAKQAVIRDGLASGDRDAETINVYALIKNDAAEAPHQRVKRRSDS